MYSGKAQSLAIHSNHERAKDPRVHVLHEDLCRAQVLRRMSVYNVLFAWLPAQRLQRTQEMLLTIQNLRGNERECLKDAHVVAGFHQTGAADSRT